MIVEITPQAQEYLRGKENAHSLMVKMVMSGGWAGFSYKPAVTAGEPENKEDFKRYDEGFFKVYVPNSFDAKKLQISYRSGFFGGLSVKAS